MDNNELEGFKYAVIKSMVQNLCLLATAIGALLLCRHWWAFIPLVFWTTAKHTDDKDKPKETKID